MLLALHILITVLCLFMLINGRLNLRRFRSDRRRLAAAPLPADPPMASILVPARNEADNIAACLESLARQDYPNYEVIVLDDCSEDDTLGIAHSIAGRFPRVKVLQGRPLDPGWIGKPHACAQLAEQARGDWLLFVDADTRLSRRALADAMRLALARDADLFSGVPRLESVGLWERLSVPMLILGGVGGVSMHLAEWPGWPTYATACGAFLLFRRPFYDQIGGHAAVRGCILDDVQIARAAKRARGRTVMTDLSHVVRCRMYRSFHDVWEGFTKNFNAAFPMGSALVVIALMLACYSFPVVAFVAGPALGWGPWTTTILPLIELVSIAWLRVSVEWRLGVFDVWGPLMTPIAALFCTVIGLRSLSRSLLRQTTPWRARRYELWQAGPESSKKLDNPARQ